MQIFPILCFTLDLAERNSGWATTISRFMNEVAANLWLCLMKQDSMRKSNKKKQTGLHTIEQLTRLKIAKNTKEEKNISCRSVNKSVKFSWNLQCMNSCRDDSYSATWFLFHSAVNKIYMIKLQLFKEFGREKIFF